MTSLLLFVLYTLAAAAVAATAVFVKRPIEKRSLAVSFLLPILFLAPSFFSDRTALPLELGRTLPPWTGTGREAARNPNLLDLSLQMLPWSEAARRSWKEGELPQRDRWNGCGTPLASNGVSAAFSPLTLLSAALPLLQAFTLQAALKLFLALTGMMLWLRELGVSRDASLLGAVAFCFSFTMTPWLFFPHTSVICVWPWALFAIELLRRDGTDLRTLGVFVGVLVFGSLGGHVESAASGAAWAGVWLLSRRVLGGLERSARLVGRVVIAGLLAVGISAFALLPQALAILASNRLALARRPFWEPLFSWLPHGPGWGNGLFTVFFPRSLGDSIESPTIAGHMGSFFEMSLAYFGIAGWACALLFLRPGSRRCRAEVALLVPLLSGWGAAVGLWPFAEIAGHLPGLGMMFPLRFLSWVAMAGAALAAFEFDRFRKDLSGNPTAAFAAVGISVVLGLFAWASFERFYNLHLAAGGLASQREALHVTWASLLAFASIASVAAWKPAAIANLGPSTLVAGICVLELLYQGGRLYHFEATAELYPQTPLIRFLRQQPSPFRVLGEGITLFPNSNVFVGLEDVRTHDPVERREYVEFLAATCGYDVREYFKQIHNVNASALDFLNVKYLLAAPQRAVPGEKWKMVYSAEDGTVFENTRVLPRVFAPGSVRVAVAGAALPQDWGSDAVLAGTGSPGLWGVSPGGARGNGSAEIFEYRESGNSASFRVRASGRSPTILVASLVQDGGWSAWDKDGRRLPTARANGPFLAIGVPEGDQVIRLKYSAPGFRAGAAVSAASLLAALLLAAAASRGLGARARIGIGSAKRKEVP